MEKKEEKRKRKKRKKKKALHDQRRLFLSWVEICKMNTQFIHVSTKSFSVRHITGIDYSNPFPWSISGCKQFLVIVWGQSKHHRLLVPWKI